jgi:xanthine dehydrogenase accessory factor
MDSIYRDIVRLFDTGAPFSLGTVVHTAGSTPQKTGARAVFLLGGEILGTLGGGCMEAEARRRGLQLARGGDPELMELHLDDDFGWDDGLICGGTASIFLQPRPGEEQVYRAAVALHEARGRGVLALVVAGDAEAVGRACLVRTGEETVGDLASPELQAAVEETAKGLLLEGREEPRRIFLKAPAATVYFEPLLPKPVCFIAGAGHIGSALCHYAARAGFEVAVVDDRPSLCNSDRMPDASHVLVGDIVEAVREWPKTPSTYFVIVTRGHRHDAVVLRELVKAPVAYLGMIGSKRKILTVYDEFLAEGLATPEELARIHAPLGLDIGAQTVEEIALCIAAELILVRRRGAEYGRERDGHRAGGGRVPADGDAQAALAVRLRNRDTGSRPLAESLPRGPRAGGPGAPQRRDCPES